MEYLNFVTLRKPFSNFLIILISFLSLSACAQYPSVEWQISTAILACPEEFREHSTVLGYREKGVLAYYNYDCYYQQNQDMRSSFNTYTDRMYYINYVLFFMIIMVQEHYKTPRRGRKIKFPQGLVNLLCIAGILGVVSSLIPLFTGNAIPTYIALKFFSGILWMSCTILVIFLVDMYFFVNKS